MIRLKSRSDFLACAASGHKWVRPSFIIQLHARAEDAETSARIGFTTTKKLGNAVARNRIRRRLKEAARLSLPSVAHPSHDYVIIGRPIAATINFQQLQAELSEGLRKLHHLVSRRATS
jgi:ribonuclease P protein component